MAWSVAEAKQKLSEVLRMAAKEPQMIQSRTRPVAVVVSTEEFEEFAAWRARRSARTLGGAFAELRALAARDAYRLRLPARRDRRDTFSGASR